MGAVEDLLFGRIEKHASMIQTRAQRALTSVQTISAFTHPLLTLPLPGWVRANPPKVFLR